MGKKATDKKAEVVFKYIFADDYKPTYASGAFGGNTPRGEIVLNFFFERPGLPYKEVFDVTEVGILKDGPKKIEPKDLGSAYIRQITNGVIMSRQTAQELQNYLNKILGTVEEEGDKK